jgi:hypothetical protein
VFLVGSVSISQNSKKQFFSSVGQDVRIIAYFPSDVDKIAPLIEKEFTVDCKHSRNTNAQEHW